MMHIEHEIALALGEQNDEQDNGQAAIKVLTQHPHCVYQRTTHLRNVYFDTPNHALKSAKAAFRLRYDTTAHCWIQTLKTAGHSHNGLSTRQEWESLLPTEAKTSDVHATPAIELALLPTKAQNYLRPIESDLQAAFRTDFQRDIYDYHQAECHFEIALDCGWIYAEPSTPDFSLTHMKKTRIFELEIELKAGGASALAHMQTLAATLSQQLNAKPQTLSKAARGYALLSR